MENVKSKKERRLMELLVLAWVLAATLGGCVVSLNIQKNNNNSEQKVEQSQMNGICSNGIVRMLIMTRLPKCLVSVLPVLTLILL